MCAEKASSLKEEQGLKSLWLFKMPLLNGLIRALGTFCGGT